MELTWFAMLEMNSPPLHPFSKTLCSILFFMFSFAYILFKMVTSPSCLFVFILWELGRMTLEMRTMAGLIELYCTTFRGLQSILFRVWDWWEMWDKGRAMIWSFWGIGLSVPVMNRWLRKTLASCIFKYDRYM